jgi:hypothetical protein
MPERNEPIPPALTDEEWAAAFVPETDARLGFNDVHSELVQAADFGRWHAAMALANAALEDGDRRKLTRDHVKLLRAQATILRSEREVERAEANDALADVLEAILLPVPETR